MAKARTPGRDGHPDLGGRTVVIPHDRHPVFAHRQIGHARVGNHLRLLPVKPDRGTVGKGGDIQGAGLRLPDKRVVTAAPSRTGPPTGGAGIDLYT